MNSPATLAMLRDCRSALAAADVSDELRDLGESLITNLVDMHEAGRLRLPVFLLALDSLELVPGLEDCVSDLRATASREDLG